MKNDSKSKSFLSTAILSFFFLFRSVLFLPEQTFTYPLMIYGDFYTHFHRAAFGICIILFSVLLSVLLNELYYSNQEFVFLPCLFICLDSVFFITQASFVKAFITDLWLLYFVVYLKRGSKNSNGIFPVFIFVSALLDPYIFFGMVLLVMLLKFVADKSITVVFFLLSVALPYAAAVLLRVFWLSDADWFNGIITEPYDFSGFVPSGIESVLLLLPVLICSVAFVLLVKNEEKTLKLNKASAEQNKKTAALAVAVVLNIFGVLFFKDTCIFSISHLIIPAFFITLIISKNKCAVSLAKKINGIIHDRKILFVIIIIVLYFAGFYFIGRKVSMPNLQRFASEYVF